MSYGCLCCECLLNTFFFSPYLWDIFLRSHLSTALLFSFHFPLLDLSGKIRIFRTPGRLVRRRGESERLSMPYQRTFIASLGYLWGLNSPVPFLVFTLFRMYTIHSFSSFFFWILQCSEFNFFRNMSSSLPHTRPSLFFILSEVLRVPQMGY